MTNANCVLSRSKPKDKISKFVCKTMEDDPLFRRTRQHAELRLSFHSGQSDKQRLVQIKEFIRLEKEMLPRYHKKGDSGLRLTLGKISHHRCFDSEPLQLCHPNCSGKHRQNSSNVRSRNGRLWKRGTESS